MYSGETSEPFVYVLNLVVPLVCLWMTRLTVGILILFSKWTVGALRRYPNVPTAEFLARRFVLMIQVVPKRVYCVWVPGFGYAEGNTAAFAHRR
jgi:hypothetical protein